MFVAFFKTHGQQLRRLMQQPFWPVWQWPKAWQWLGGALVVLGCMSLGAVFWWAERTDWIKTEEQLRVVHLQLSELRQGVAVQAEIPDPAVKPSSTSLGAMSAQWIAQAEQVGLRVLQWSISPTIAIPTSTHAADQQIHKAGFSVQIQGPYGTIKSWLGQTLHAQSWMVLDKMQLRLSDVGSGILEANISLSVYVDD